MSRGSFVAFMVVKFCALGLFVVASWGLFWGLVVAA